MIDLANELTVTVYSISQLEEVPVVCPITTEDTNEIPKFKLYLIDMKIVEKRIKCVSFKKVLCYYNLYLRVESTNSN